MKVYVFINNGVLTRSSIIVHRDVKTFNPNPGSGAHMGGAVVHTASILTNIACDTIRVVSRYFRVYKVQDVVVYMPPTITYIYGLKKHLSMLISPTSTIFKKWELVEPVVLLSTWLCAKFSHT